MKDKNTFYIGWKGSMDAAQGRFLKRWLFTLGVLVIVVLFVLIYFQKPFNDHQFKLGKIDRIEGVYYSDPLPMLVVDGPQSSDVLLVGFGKYGAEGTMEKIESEVGNLNGKRITLEGTLIQGDDKVLMELTNGTSSLISGGEVSGANLTRSMDEGSVSLRGEILDPKCYFGVMKPAEGKIHKSCAIRCISGGIPPVYRVGVDYAQEQYDYYILLSQDGNPINKEVLAYVAEDVVISGRKGTYGSWDLLYLDVADIKLQ